ncbi:OmpA family protein [Paracoccaceae bacterium Fryx2]|nr:OmpA family protein [Paracoccaceae bacterium Fryx2]
MALVSLLRNLTLRVLVLGILGLALPMAATAQSNPFEGGWTLQPEASSLRFQSVKNLTKIESSGFVTFTGAIEPSGAARITVLLDSVDTKIDLRNVRMRFLLFETFQFPEAMIETTIDPAWVTDLETVRRKTVLLPYTLSLHGVTKAFEAEVTLTLIDANLVAVSTAAPIPVATSDFALDDGVRKLEEAATVAIVPSATVSFDFIFARNGTAAATPAPVLEQPAAVALEAAGDFDPEACKGRFEVLSRSGNIYFRAGSARLDPQSAPLLDSLADIIARCPGMTIEVSGHTDADGSEATNQRLSQQRAESVAAYLASKGIEPGHMVSVGYGEARPVAGNDTAENKARNRRIEFAVVNG